MSLLRPELCLGTKEPAVKSHFRACPSLLAWGAWGRVRHLEGLQEWGQAGRAEDCCWRERLSAVVWATGELLFFHVWPGRSRPGSSVLGLGVSSCYAVILLCRRNRLFLNQIGVRVFIKAFHGCLSVSSCLAQRCRQGNLSRKHLLDVLLASGTPQCMAGLVCKYISNVSENRKLLEPQKTDGRDPERQFTALTFPMTMAAQLEVPFAWAALKIPQ